MLQSAIVGGVDDTGPNAHESVVLLSGPGGTCTASLIAPNLVLTAWHCVAPTIVEGIGCSSEGHSYDGDQVGNDHPATQMEVYTGYKPKVGKDTPAAKGKQIFHEAGKELCDADLALVVLDQAVNLSPMPLRLGFGPLAHEPVTSVGYGVTIDGRWSSSGTRRRRDNVDVLSTGRDWNFLTGDGEAALSTSMCSGDSGGPTVSNETGAILGVHSRVGDCVLGGGVLTNLHAHTTLLDKAFAAAGATPTAENKEEPEPIEKKGFGGSCESGYECLWALCLDQPEAGFCSNFCDAESKSCPAGYYCVDYPTMFKFDKHDALVCARLPNDDSCKSCRANSCTIELQKCSADKDCSALLDCVDLCEHEGCRQLCITQHSGGTALYNALFDCACTYGCGEKCADCSLPPAPDPGTGGGGGGGGGGDIDLPVPNDDGNDGGCSLGNSQRNTDSAWLWLMAAALSVRRRRAAVAVLD